MKTMICTLLILVLCAESALFAVDAKHAAYLGGTATEFAGATDPIDAALDTSQPDALTLTADKKPFKGVVLAIPYTRIVDLEYGQKAGRRVGAAVATTVLLGPLGLVTLFSKKRKHYLTIGYTDAANAAQVAVIELGKDAVRSTLAIVETRSGQAMTYQDEDARKAGK